MTDTNEQAVPVVTKNSSFKVDKQDPALQFTQQADFGNTHVAFNPETKQALIYVDNGDHKNFTAGDVGATANGRYGTGGAYVINGERKNSSLLYDSGIEDKVYAAVKGAFANGSVTVDKQHELTDLAIRINTRINPDYVLTPDVIKNRGR